MRANSRLARLGIGCGALLLALTLPAVPASASPSAPSVPLPAQVFPDFDGDGQADHVYGVGSLQSQVVVAYGSGATDTFGREQVGGTAVEPDNALGFGQGLLARDLNTDGFTDLVVVDQSQGGAGSALHLVFGASDGLSLGTALRYPVPAGVYAFRGAPALVTEPSSLLVVGAYTSLAKGGAVVAYQLDANGIPNTAPAVLSQAQLPGADEGGDGFGTAIAASGSMLLIGAPGEDVGKVRDAGAVTVLRYLGDVRFTGAAVTQNTKGVAGKAEAGDRFGAAVAIADGYAAVGVPGEDSSRRDSGAVATFSLSGDLLKPLATLTQASKGVAGSSETGDRFGAAVAVVRGCLGVPALLAGAPGEASRTALAAGSAWVLPLAKSCAGIRILGSPVANAGLGAAVSAERVPGVPTDQLGGVPDRLVLAAPGLLEEGVTGRVLTLDYPYRAPVELATGLQLNEEGTIALSPPMG